jgi:ubiquinone/menaquinone biosynthesis C-methylase UbiE
MNCRNDLDEAARIDVVYSSRGYDTDPEYSDSNPVYLQRVQSMERATLEALRSAQLKSSLAELSILDFGCGNARWFGRWIAWGAAPSNLTGVDLRANAIVLASATFPQCNFQIMPEGRIPFADNSFDIVAQNVVFSSILDDQLRHLAAAEIARVLRPNGIALWCDFTFNNPNNPNVRGVSKRDILTLFPGFEVVVMKRIILAPPIARRLVPRSRLGAEIAETCFPFLCSHLFALLRKL